MSCSRQQEDAHDSTKGMPTTLPKDCCAALPSCLSTSVPSNTNAPHRRVRSMAETLEDRNFPPGQPTLTFRVTGASSVARLEPLLLGQGGRNQRPTIWSRSLDSGDDGVRVDFVWETTVTKQQQRRHRDARVLNRLSGAQVLEDKANLVLLQRLMTAPTLESYAVNGRNAVARWAQQRFKEQNLPRDRPPPPPSTREAGYPHDDQFLARKRALVQGTSAATETTQESEAVGNGHAGEEDWWCVKAAGGNGGLDIWVLHKGNWKMVTEALSEHESYVIQRYVARPMLWQGRKFHFRAYALLRADMSAWLYRTAYILSASRPYSLGGNDSRDDGVRVGADVADMHRAAFADEFVHISNLAVNKHTEGHPGQVPCDLPSEYGALWPKMLELLGSLVDAATPFMQHQANPNHFEFLGLDIIADSAGGVWLMEANRLPGLQSSKQNLDKENEVYDGMMLDLIRLLVLPPLIGCPPEQGLFEVAATPASGARAPSTETWRNVMRFAAFKRSCRTKTHPS
ncbi:unnamed protein product [Ectocarpus sp. 6 AP-2014]